MTLHTLTLHTPVPNLWVLSALPHWLIGVAMVCMAIVATLIVLILFEPSLEYRMDPIEPPLESDEFVRLLSVLTDAEAHRDSRSELLVDGATFYEAELAAIAAAEHSVHLEGFIFNADQTGTRLRDAMAERARAGVKVKLVADAFGSLLTPNSFFEPLRAAGGQIAWYQPLRWFTLKRLNNRTHRKLLVVDGKVGFIGGADVSDRWVLNTKKNWPWRDSVLRIEGKLVAGLQTAFAENWLEATGEILVDGKFFPATRGDGGGDGDGADRAAGMVVVSTPTGGRSSHARVLFQALMVSAQKEIQITSPYFLPDRPARRALTDAVKRGVRVRVLVPGKVNNHVMARHASRRRYGELLQAGIEIFEYQPRMIHAKLLQVDGLWSVVGSTNFDSRSFELNDEVNLAARDAKVAGQLADQFERDLTQSEKISFEQWSKRPLRRVMEVIGLVLERQE